MVLSGLFIVVFYSWASIVFSVGTLCGLLATGRGVHLSFQFGSLSKLYAMG